MSAAMTPSRIVAALAGLCCSAALASPALGALEDHARAERARELHRQQTDAFLRTLVPSSRGHAPRALTGEDYEHVEVDAALDLVTGAVNATATFQVRAVGDALGHLAVLVDEGLAVLASGAAGRDVFPLEYGYPPYNYLILVFDPPLPAGEVETVTVSYGGRLVCRPQSAQWAGECVTTASGFSFFHQGSVMPRVVHASATFEDDRMTRALTLRLAPGSQAAVSARRVSVVDDALGHLSRWEQNEPMPSWFNFIIVTGEVTLGALPGSSPPAELVYRSDLPGWNEEVAGWTPHILDFLDAQAGQALPYDRIYAVKIPHESRFIGTVGWGMTLLADTYALYGEEYYEETWAHEHAHQWWATVVTPADMSHSRLLTEGLATLTQMDYTAARRYPEVDPHLYLAGRYHELGLVLRYRMPNLPPVVVEDAAQVPSDDRYTTWAYHKTAAVLDHLRVTLGEAPFAQGLRLFAADCAFVPCDTARFREHMEQAWGRPLSTFFDRHVYGDRPLDVRVSLSRTTSGDAHLTQVTVTHGEDEPLALQLWLELEDGTRRIEQVEVPRLSGELTFQTQVKVLRARPSPRHEVVLRTRSAVEGDLDFDGVVDGLDLLRCAHRVGLPALRTPTAQNLNGVEVRFDPRCDLDLDGALTRADLDGLAARFGNGVVP